MHLRSKPSTGLPLPICDIGRSPRMWQWQPYAQSFLSSNFLWPSGAFFCQYFFAMAARSSYRRSWSIARSPLRAIPTWVCSALGPTHVSSATTSSSLACATAKTLKTDESFIFRFLSNFLWVALNEISLISIEILRRYIWLVGKNHENTSKYS